MSIKHAQQIYDLKRLGGFGIPGITGWTSSVAHHTSLQPYDQSENMYQPQAWDWRDIVRAPGLCLHYGVISQGRHNDNWVFISILTKYNMKSVQKL